MPRRAGSTFILASTLILATLLPASGTGAVPTLGAINTITAARASYMRVRIPAPVTVSTLWERNPDISIDGSGRFKGLVLVREGGADDRDYLTAVRVPDGALCGPTYCGTTPAIAAAVMIVEPFDFWRDEPDASLPAGTYLLHALADGGSVSVTLRLHGLRGKTDLRPRRPARLHVWDWEPEVPLSPYQVEFWDGVTRTVGRDGMDGSLLWRVMSPVVGPDETYNCYYIANPDPPTGYLPGCPYADMRVGWGWDYVGTIPYARMSFSVGTWWGLPGRHGLEVWSTIAAPVEKIGGIAFMLTYGG